MPYTHYTIVVDAEAVDRANAAARVVNPDGGPWFTTGYCPGSTDAPTHYICAVALNEGLRAELEAAGLTDLVASGQARIYQTREAHKAPGPHRRNCADICADLGGLRPQEDPCAGTRTR